VSRLPFLLPAFAAGSVAVALFIASQPRPELAARVFGGPTAASHFSGFVELVELELSDARAAAGRSVDVRVSGAGFEPKSSSVRSDAAGRAWFAFTLPEQERDPRLELTITERTNARERVRARGSVLRNRAEWQAHATRRGGWVNGSSASTLRVRAAALSGVLAVPFQSQFVVEVSTTSGPLANARVELQADGAEFEPGQRELRRETGADGRATFPLRPFEHFAELRAHVTTSEHGEAELRLGLQIVPGAFFPMLQGSQLRIRSPVPRAEAFFAIVDETSRYQGGRVALNPASNGTADAVVELTGLPARPFWVVLSSEPDLASPAAVGWPMGERAREPLATFDVRDVLLYDGIPEARERQRIHQRRTLLLASGACVLALLLVATWLVRSVRASKLTLSTHLAETLAEEPLAERIQDPGLNALRLAVGLLLVGLGFVVFLLILLYRAG
jgi:hypothetical protein